MNKKQKKINKAQRKIKRLEIIYELEKQYINEHIITDAYILNIDIKNIDNINIYIYSVYILKYNLEEKIESNNKYEIYNKIKIKIIPFLKKNIIGIK